MATFSAQVVDLVGSFSDEAALDTWITEGANEIINAMPRAMRERVAEETQFTANVSSEGHKVLHVLRSDGTIEHPCRRVPARRRGVIQDSTHIEYASATYPAFIEKDATIIVYPTPDSNNGKLVSIPIYSQASPLDASAISAITNFPNDVEYLVTLYAAIKALQQNMNSKLGNADITTALTAINTELDETQAICDLINTQVDAAVVELAEAAASVDSSVDTTIGLINTAVDRVNAAVLLSNTQFDSAVTANTSEDIELAASHVTAGNGFLGEAQGSLGEAQGYASEVSAMLNQVSAQAGQVAGGYIGAAQGYASEIASKIAIAQGYGSEAQARLGVISIEYQWLEKQQAKLQQDYDKGVALMRGAA